MDGETDPMLGDEEEQSDYRKQIAQRMQEAADEVRAARRGFQAPPESPSVITGTTGYGDSIRVLDEQ